MTIRNLFYGPKGTLRSGWRFAVFLALFVLIGGTAGAAASFLLSAVAMGGDAGTTVYLAVNAAISITIALGLGWFCARYLEKLPFRSLGAAFSKGWVGHLILGVLVGALTVSIAALTAYIAGGISFRSNTANSWNEIARSMSVSLVVFALAAAFEEALFRGYMLQTFARSGLAWFAIILTSLFFAAVHLGNPNANWISSVNTGIAGIWFGFAYLRTRDLWFVTGLHLMWNWTQGAVFGIEVSGLTDLIKSPLLKEIDLGPEWLTGGAYGLEGGIVTTVALIASIAAIRVLPILTPDPALLAMTSPQSTADFS